MKPSETKPPKVAGAPERLVDEWFIETFHGIPDLKVEHYNRFRAAADVLKARLAGKETT